MNEPDLKNLIDDKTLVVTDARVIPYPDSPTKKGYMGTAKSPLQKVKDGYGYMGVLMQTDNRTLVQCHVCGKWMELISPTHLATHKLTGREYREKFGLRVARSLVSDKRSYTLEKNGRETYLKHKTQMLKNLQKGHVQWKEQKNTNENTVEYQNQYGTCEKQLGFRLREYLETYKMLPSRSTKGEGGKICKAMHRRYGSVNDGFDHYGLPVRHRTGTRVVLVSPQGKQMAFNYNKMYSRDEIYKWITENSILTKLEEDV